MSAPLNGVSLSRVLGGEQIVGYGDDGKENEDEQRQRNELRGKIYGAVGGARHPPQPQAYHGDGDKGPGEIEE